MNPCNKDNSLEPQRNDARWISTGLDLDWPPNSWTLETCWRNIQITPPTSSTPFHSPSFFSPWTFPPKKTLALLRWQRLATLLDQLLTQHWSCEVSQCSQWISSQPNQLHFKNVIDNISFIHHPVIWSGIHGRQQQTTGRSLWYGGNRFSNKNSSSESVAFFGFNSLLTVSHAYDISIPLYRSNGKMQPVIQKWSRGLKLKKFRFLEPPPIPPIIGEMIGKTTRKPPGKSVSKLYQLEPTKRPGMRLGG